MRTSAENDDFEKTIRGGGGGYLMILFERFYISVLSDITSFWVNLGLLGIGL